MNENQIITEVRKNRESILESFDGDVVAMLKDSMRKQRKDGRKVVSFASKKSERDAEGVRAALTR